MADDLNPSERELDILKVLWEHGSASVRRVRDALASRDELAFNTVQTLLRIMEEKGLVKHHVEGRSFIYSPRYSRERVAFRFLKKVFDGALDQFVLSILGSKDGPSDPNELKELERLIANARRKKQIQREED